MKKIFFLKCWWLFFLLLSFMNSQLWALPLKSQILDAQKRPVANVLIYIDFVEILDLQSKLIGRVGIVNLEGELQLFLVKEDESKTFLGSAQGKKLFDSQNNLIGYYDWTTFWSYAYDEQGKTLGAAKCIAFRGICAAGSAAYLTGLLTRPPAVKAPTPETIPQPEPVTKPEPKLGDGGVILD